MSKQKIPAELQDSKNWNKKEAENVRIICGFIEDLMIEHDVEKVLSEYGNSAYTQHNRNVPDGMEGIAEYVGNFAKQFPEFTYDVKRIIADGDYVVFHSHATIKKKDRGNDQKGMNITDTWRLEDGKIVEHWDSIQAIDFSMRLFSLINGGKVKNRNGVF